MQVNDKVQELVLNVCNKSKHIFPHIHGDCNLTHFRNCLPYINPEGLWLEFGVYQGKTIGTIADLRPDKTIYGFDCFEGLPEDWNSENPKGSYTLGGTIPNEIDRGENVIHGQRFKPWNENIVLIKGYFEDTLPEFAEEYKERIAFIHIDSDLYSSAKTIFKRLGNQILPGTVICFDDWCGYPHCSNVDHEVKAFAEYLCERSYDYEPISFQTDISYCQVGFLIK